MNDIIIEVAVNSLHIKSVHFQRTKQWKHLHTVSKKCWTIFSWLHGKVYKRSSHALWFNSVWTRSKSTKDIRWSTKHIRWSAYLCRCWHSNKWTWNVYSNTWCWKWRTDDWIWISVYPRERLSILSLQLCYTWECWPTSSDINGKKIYKMKSGPHIWKIQQHNHRNFKMNTSYSITLNGERKTGFSRGQLYCANNSCTFLNTAEKQNRVNWDNINKTKTCHSCGIDASMQHCPARKVREFDGYTNINSVSSRHPCLSVEIATQLPWSLPQKSSQGCQERGYSWNKILLVNTQWHADRVGRWWPAPPVKSWKDNGQWSRWQIWLV